MNFKARGIYQDPTTESKSTTLFWSITPTLEAVIVPNATPALLPMLQKAGAIISGLLLLNGDFDHEGTLGQIRTKDGEKFDQASGLTLHLPLNHTLPARIKESIDLWNITAGKRAEKSEPRLGGVSLLWAAAPKFLLNGLGEKFSLDSFNS